MTLTGKQVVKLLTDNGWVVDRISGSHYIMVKEGCKPISVPVHSGNDLPKGLLHKILKQAGLE